MPPTLTHLVIFLINLMSFSSIHEHILLAHPEEFVVLRRILFNLLVDFDFEFLELLLDLVIDVPLVHQEVVRVVLFFLLRVMDILAKLPYMIYC